LRLPIHREGWLIIAISCAIDAILFVLAPAAGWVFLPVVIWVIAFFRDPERRTPLEPDIYICPADGRMLPLVEAAPPEELEMPPARRTRLSVFMNVFNVHVNRIPCDGTVIAMSYRPGKFFNASFDKASVHNERMSIRIRPEGETSPEKDIALVQIAGLVARRIVCGLTPGQRVHRGQRFGIIRFGSRVDLYLPENATIYAQPGERVMAGQTVLAAIKG
jgi:phosphatidylserine decarboxylase